MNGKLIVIAGIDGSGKTVQTSLLANRLRKDGHNVATIDFPQYGNTFFSDMITSYLRGEFGIPAEIREYLAHIPVKTQGQVKYESQVKDQERTLQHYIKALDKVNPYLASLLYAGDRWECREKLSGWLSEGNTVISNRYTCCNKAHQGAKIGNQMERRRFFEWVNTLECHVYNIPGPDATIFLYMDVMIAKELIGKRAKARCEDPKVYPNTGRQQDKGLSLQKQGVQRDIHEEDIDYLKTVQDTYLELASIEKDWERIDCVRGGCLLTEDEIAEAVWKVVKSRLAD